MSPLLDIRAARQNDRAFIVNSWKETMKAFWLAEMLKQIGRLSTKAEVRVACDKEDPDSIAAFAVFEGPVLHFVYVRQILRKQGIARDLLKSLELTTYSQTTPLFEVRIKPAERGWNHVPRIH